MSHAGKVRSTAVSNLQEHVQSCYRPAPVKPLVNQTKDSLYSEL
jgi:hypothetical protein